MFRILFRLYLVTIVSYSAAIYLVPDLVIKLFHERFVSYNLDYSRGLQSLIVKQFHGVPQEQWPGLAEQMDKGVEHEFSKVRNARKASNGAGSGRFRPLDERGGILRPVERDRRTPHPLQDRPPALGSPRQLGPQG